MTIPKQQIKHKELRIKALVKKFNKLCQSLAGHIKANGALAGCVAPEQLNLKSLFEINIDDPIWFDAGLSEDNKESAVPCWLGDDDVRQGIVGLLEVDRCKEELKRLKHKCSNLQSWFAAQWESTMQAHRNAEGAPSFIFLGGIQLTSDTVHHPTVAFHLKQWLSNLHNLCWVWRTKVDSLPTDGSPCLPWGPTLVELADGASRGTEWKYAQDIQVTRDNHSNIELMLSDDEDGLIMEDDPMEDKYILEALEALELNDACKESDFCERQNHELESVRLQASSIWSVSTDP
jgi:hypothetical protein